LLKQLLLGVKWWCHFLYFLVFYFVMDKWRGKHELEMSWADAMVGNKWYCLTGRIFGMGFCGSMHCRRCFLEEGRAAWAMDCHCSFCLVVSLNSGGRVASAPLSREAIPPLERSLPPAWESQALLACLKKCGHSLHASSVRCSCHPSFADIAFDLVLMSQLSCRVNKYYILTRLTFDNQTF
jgi:hypothetical protein